MAYCIRRIHNFIQTPSFPLQRRRNCYIFISIPACLPMSPGNMFAPSATKKIKTFINFLYTPVLKNRNRCVPTTGSASARSFCEQIPPRTQKSNSILAYHRQRHFFFSLRMHFYCVLWFCSSSVFWSEKWVVQNR